MKVLCKKSFIPFLMSVQLPARAAVGALHLIAVGTIDGFIPSGQERHLGLIATTGTGHAIHLARLTCSTAIATAPAIAATSSLFACGPAGRTARRRICQTSAGKKLLLTGGEGKLLTTVATIQNLILKSHRLSLFQGRSPLLNSVYRARQEISDPANHCTLQRLTSIAHFLEKSMLEDVYFLLYSLNWI